MDRLRQWVLLTLVAVLVVGTGGWFLLVSPQRSQAADLASQAQAQQSANRALTAQLAVLKAQAKDLPRQQARLAAVAAKIPDNPAEPALIRALDRVAASAGVELVSLSPSAPAPVGASMATAPSATGTAVPSGGLSSITVSLNVVGGYFAIEQFLDGLEGLPRALKVESLTLLPGTSPTATGSASATAASSTLSATINGRVYLTSSSSAAGSAAVPVAPAAPAAPTATTAGTAGAS